MYVSHLSILFCFKNMIIILKKFFIALTAILILNLKMRLY